MGAACTSCIPCSPSAALASPAPPPDEVEEYTNKTFLLLPPPTTIEYNFYANAKNTRLPSNVLPAYPPLDTIVIADVFESVIFVNPSLFFSFIQQKTTDPSSWILYDLQPKTEFRKGHLKFAQSLVEYEDSSRPSVDKVQLLDKLSRHTAGKIVLLYGNKPDPTQCPLMNLLHDCLADLTDLPRAVFVLNTSYFNLCYIYPHAFHTSPLTLPGPTEVLYSAVGFCLYLSDLRTAKANLSVLQNVHDIRDIINLTDFSLKGLTPLTLYESDIPSKPNPSPFLLQQFKTLIRLSQVGLPLLLIEVDDNQYASLLIITYLIYKEWSFEDAKSHLLLRKFLSNRFPSIIQQAKNALLQLQFSVNAHTNTQQKIRCVEIAIFQIFQEDDL